MASKKFLCLFLLLVLLPGTHCAQWSSGPDPDVVLRACAGTTLSLPWHLITDQGATIDTVRWFYSGMSDQMIATYTYGTFFPTSAFSGRAHNTTNGGIDIDHVTSLESGNYSVQVTVRDSNGDLHTLSRSVVVSVDDGLQTTDGHLHVVQEAVAEYSNLTGQHHVVLRCGTFTYPAHPPFSATWETPTGQQVSSSGYKDGKFYLLLPNPVGYGSYVCNVPPASACIQSGLGRAVLTVDTLEARLSVLDAQQGHLQNDLNAKVNALQTENGDLKVQVSHLQTDNHDLKAQVNRLQSEVSHLETSNTALTHRVDVVEHQAHGDRKRVSFHVGLNQDAIVDPDQLVRFMHVITNEGDAYNRHLGWFVAPYSGTYCFLASAETSDFGYRVSMKLIAASREVGYFSTYSADNYGTGTLHAVVHLNAGESVHVHSDSHHGYFFQRSTFFSGFLLYED